MWSSYGKKRGKNGKRLGLPAHDDLLAHIDDSGRARPDFVFATSGVNQVWLTDIATAKRAPHYDTDQS